MNTVRPHSHLIDPRTVVIPHPALVRPAVPDPTRPEVGSQLGDYLLVSLLASGGMGHVYLANDTSLGRSVIIKTLAPRYQTMRDYHSRLRHEARIHARINCRHVPALYTVINNMETGPALVMEHLSGETLAQRIERCGSMHWEQAILLFLNVLQGLDYIHRKGIVHQDLKPGNLFLTDSGDLKIFDFGISTSVQPDINRPAATLVGTLLYIAPEQLNGRTTDYRSDLYTLGVSLFETLTGRLPFEKQREFGLMHAHLTEPAPNPGRYRNELPKRLQHVILRALEKDPQKRFCNAAEFHDALLACLPANTITPVIIPLGDCRKHSTEPTAKRLPRILRNLVFDATLVGVLLLMAASLGSYPENMFTTAKTNSVSDEKYAILKQAWKRNSKP